MRLAQTECTLELTTKQFRTIAQFKEEVSQKFGVPATEQVLVYSNRQLMDGETFAELIRSSNLSEGDLIHLFWIHAVQVTA